MSCSISYQAVSLYSSGNLENYSKIWPLLIAVGVIAAERWMPDFMTFCCLSFRMIRSLLVFIVVVTSLITARRYPSSQEIMLMSKINQHSCYSGSFMLFSVFFFFNAAFKVLLHKFSQLFGFRSSLWQHRAVNDWVTYLFRGKTHNEIMLITRIT